VATSGIHGPSRPNAVAGRPKQTGALLIIAGAAIY
jgi:hypothetical protein